MCAFAATVTCATSAQVNKRIPGDLIRTDNGRVAGTLLDKGIHAYFGIPFAAPPVGDLRWHEPMPAKPWTGVYDASAPKPGCAQATFEIRPDSYPEPHSEDCLYLSVWTPPAAKPGAKLPVMVYIHGGGFSGGTPNLPAYAGDQIARKGVVTVNLAYRLGIFGFFAHPELTAESGHNGSGDWGNLDQIAGLKWIQRNIAAFGGDPANVTIMGESAGSESVYLLMASPLAHGLFAKASGWSGAGLAPGAPVLRSLAEGEAIGLKVQQILNAKNLAEMRAVPWEQVLVALRKAEGGQDGPGDGIHIHPFVDGYFLPDQPHSIFLAGKQNDVPLYTSSTQQDLMSAAQFYDNGKTVADLKKLAAASFGEFANQFLRLFPAANDEEARKAALIVTGDTGFGVSNRDWARDQALTGRQPVYLAQWAHTPPPDKPDAKGPRDDGRLGNGPIHSSDIPYWLGTYVHNTDKVWSSWDKQLSEDMQETLIAFAKSGNPSTDTVKIPRYDPKNEQRVVFGDSAISIETMNTEQIEFLRAHPPRRVVMGGH